MYTTQPTHQTCNAHSAINTMNATQETAHPMQQMQPIRYTQCRARNGNAKEATQRVQCMIHFFGTNCGEQFTIGAEKQKHSQCSKLKLKTWLHSCAYL